MDWILFYHVGTMNCYMWNGEYPVGVTPKGEAWCDVNDIKVTPEEVKAITSVIGNRKRTFKIKGRGEFHVVEKGKFIQK